MKLKLKTLKMILPSGLLAEVIVNTMKLLYTACSKVSRMTGNNILSTCIARKTLEKSVLDQEITFVN